MFKKLFKSKKNAADLRKMVLQKLATITPPISSQKQGGARHEERQGDIVSLGLVSDIFIADKQAFFAITVAFGAAHDWEIIRLNAQKITEEISGIDKAIVSLTAEKEMTENAMQKAQQASQKASVNTSQLDKHSSHDTLGKTALNSNNHGHQAIKIGANQQPAQKSTMPAHTLIDKTASPNKPSPKRKKPASKAPIAGIKHIIAVASGKGGVGKSTVAINLATACVKQGLKVGLLDADIYGPSLPKLTGIVKPKGEDIVSFQDKKLLPLEQYGLKLMSMGFLVDEAAPIVWRGPMVMSAINQMLHDVIWGELDLLIVDMPPGTGDAQLTLAQKVPLSGAVIVSTPQELALIDARKGLEMFHKVEVPILGLVENMCYFIAPDTGKYYHIFGKPNAEGLSGVQQEAAKLEVPYLGALPLDPLFGQSAETGKPVALNSDNEASQHYYQIAAKITQSLCLEKDS